MSFYVDYVPALTIETESICSVSWRSYCLSQLRLFFVMREDIQKNESTVRVITPSVVLPNIREMAFKLYARQHPDFPSRGPHKTILPQLKNLHCRPAKLFS